ncbi:MAG: carboxymuconolactone decarboxylase family protein, partial [Verrucomicrobia bacterium]|nr:carboxymuconolactone decarboxylase family protein [Verrucomicrobiota bacterium]
MQRMHSITDQEAGPSVEPIFAMIKKKFGRVVNMFRYMANSPIAVQAFSSLSECCEKSSLGAGLRHKISLLVSQENNCTYCIAAHSQI